MELHDPAPQFDLERWSRLLDLLEERDNPTRQVAYAERLLDEMEVSGTLDEEGRHSVLDLLDDLACAGLLLIEDEEGVACRAYLDTVGEEA